MRLRCTPTLDDLLYCLGQGPDLARVGPNHECCKFKENMVEHELRNRWKRSYLGKL
jgi:hypothetical protein